ncbi:MAG: TauD/TfdA family dioxygenase [Rhizobiales bacterium]|nr:TauD/TfdA family dioxygenase [Hyphomicrobiales bacterium]
MSISIKQLHPLFAAEMRGADLAGGISAATRRAIQQAMDDDAVLVLPEQRLDDATQIAFTSLYGPLELAPPVRGKTGTFIDGGRIRHREIFDVSNLDENGRILDLDDQRRAYGEGNQLWHTDSSFRQKSATWSLLHARVIPPDGGDTEFADTRAAYDALPQAMKDRLDGLIAEHSIWHSRAQLGGYMPTEEEREARPPAQHPVVRRHPGSGRKALYIASHASHIAGWPVEDGRALLRELLAFATQPRFVYTHKWRTGDLVIWDNRCTLHRATPFESAHYVRDLRRTTVIDTRVEVAQESCRVG